MVGLCHLCEALHKLLVKTSQLNYTRPVRRMVDADFEIPQDGMILRHGDEFSPPPDTQINITQKQTLAIESLITI